jgi:rfaE bifunctional protein kinase chain/domain
MKKKVLVSGNFNVIHPGHIRLLSFASSLGAELIVALLPKGGNNIFEPKDERLFAIKALNMVSDCFVMNESLIDVVRNMRPDYIVKGSEHAHRFNPEDDVLKEYGGKLIFSSGESWDGHQYPNVVPQSNGAHLIHDLSYLNRHEISFERLESIVKKFKKLNVLVLGDCIVDEYIDVEPIGLSMEDASVVTAQLNSIKYVGGAGFVAIQARELCDKTTFFSMTGSDNLRNYVITTLTDQDVNYNLFEDFTRPTIHKIRYQSLGRTLFRLSKFRQHPIDLLASNGLSDQIISQLSDYDLVIFSDFSYGYLSQEMIDAITSSCIDKGIMVVADSQSSSQNGNIGKFKHMDLITPTEYEARQVFNGKSDGLVTVASSLVNKLKPKNFFITLGSDGLLIHCEDNSPHSSLITDQIGALNKNPVNVSGAGDTLLVFSSMALAVGATIWEAGYIGSIAAGIKISTLGNSPISALEIQQSLVI